MKADLIVTNIGQLVTCASPDGPKRLAEMCDVGSIDDGAIAITDRKFAAVGSGADISAKFESDLIVDAAERSSSQASSIRTRTSSFGGDRLDEFELKIKGADYLEILESGGGIISTVRKTREASLDELVELGIQRLDKMLACGTTTCEIKTGYGLDLETELKMLDAIAVLDERHAIDIVPTFLAAHAVPPEFKANTNGYVDLICNKMLPAAWTWFVRSPFHRRTSSSQMCFAKRMLLT
jgi:imidazolonepropionase